MQVTIEKGIAIPPVSGGNISNELPIAQMEVNDSILIPSITDKQAVARTASKLVNWGKKNGVRFTHRTLKEGMRIWRIA